METPNLAWINKKTNTKEKIEKKSHVLQIMCFIKHDILIYIMYKLLVSELGNFDYCIESCRVFRS